MPSVLFFTKVGRKSEESYFLLQYNTVKNPTAVCLSRYEFVILTLSCQ
jgi:hypothetical protein